ncbi:hypothetical protein [Lacisediminimonas profundi]|uniref:hypothetical protein n=1 Tax=Lacisediminimonas profundi TaxID=2603856 RepID=UPI00124B1E95|nr:hypothetical protein [Lacisediminimonas profundi]
MNVNRTPQAQLGDLVENFRSASNHQKIEGLDPNASSQARLIFGTGKHKFPDITGNRTQARSSVADAIADLLEQGSKAAPDGAVKTMIEAATTHVRQKSAQGRALHVGDVRVAAEAALAVLERQGLSSWDRGERVRFYNEKGHGIEASLKADEKVGALNKKATPANTTAAASTSANPGGPGINTPKRAPPAKPPKPAHLSGGPAPQTARKLPPPKPSASKPVRTVPGQVAATPAPAPKMPSPGADD